MPATTTTAGILATNSRSDDVRARGDHRPSWVRKKICMKDAQRWGRETRLANHTCADVTPSLLFQGVLLTVHPDFQINTKMKGDLHPTKAIFQEIFNVRKLFVGLFLHFGNEKRE